MMCAKIAVVGIVAVLLAVSLSSAHASNEHYGVDASFPIHHSFVGDNPSLSTTLKHFGPDKIDMYQNYIAGCREKYDASPAQCDWNDGERLRLNREQPPEMTNYTAIGFEKTRLSDELWTTLREYWEEFMNTSGIEGMTEEVWPAANTYTNHWSTPTRMHNVHNQHTLHEPIWKEIEEKVKAWIPSATGFSRSSLYGIRAYLEGAILATHVDRDPLITSAIINVGQDTDERWPLEVYDHDGNAHNITMEPGDVVLYESHSVLHGRPFPLQGKYFANIFVHFKPFFGEAEEESWDDDGTYEDEEEESDDDGNDEL
ncbi:hypothetical protein ACHAXT_008133 [Thalassiosira profunda]